MNDIALQMGDIDGNFVREFQTQFHARLFELACFAYLDSQGLTVDPSTIGPTFWFLETEYRLQRSSAKEISSLQK